MIAPIVKLLLFVSFLPAPLTFPQHHEAIEGFGGDPAFAFESPDELRTPSGLGDGVGVVGSADGSDRLGAKTDSSVTSKVVGGAASGIPNYIEDSGPQR